MKIETTIGTRQQPATIELTKLVQITAAPSYTSGVSYEIEFTYNGQKYVGTHPVGNWMSIQYLREDGSRERTDQFCIGIGWWDLDRLWCQDIDCERASRKWER